MPKATPDGLVRLIWTVNRGGYDILSRREMLRMARDPKHPLTFSSIGWSFVGPDDTDFIVPLGGKARVYEAALLEHAIFLALANSAKQPGADGVLAFANEWGQLTNEPCRPLGTFLKERDSMVQALSPRDNDLAPLLQEIVPKGASPASLRSSHHRELGRLQARSVREGARSRFFFQAETLLQFCALELLRTREGGIDITACAACGKFLPLHKKGRTKLYCNDACKMLAYRIRRSDRIKQSRSTHARERA
jgi:hypothetical protein